MRKARKNHDLSPDGRFVAYESNEPERYENGDQLMAVAVETGAELDFGRPELLFEKAFRPGFHHGRNYDVSPDGRRFDPVEGRAQEGSFEIHAVLDWVAELEARLESG